MNISCYYNTIIIIIILLLLLLLFLLLLLLLVLVLKYSSIEIGIMQSPNTCSNAQIEQ